MYLPVLAKNLKLPALVYNFITIPGPEFLPALSPQFVFVFTALAYDLNYRSGAEFACTLLLVVVAVVVVIVVVVISLE